MVLETIMAYFTYTIRISELSYTSVEQSNAFSKSHKFKRKLLLPQWVYKVDYSILSDYPPWEGGGASISWWGRREGEGKRERKREEGKKGRREEGKKGR